MTINWPLFTFLFCISIPGIVIAIQRLINFLLAQNTDELKRRTSRFAILQTLFMVLILTFAGTVIAPRTGLGDPLLEGLLQGTKGMSAFLPLFTPIILYALFGFIIFCILYYQIINRIVDKHSLEIMTKLRLALGLDGFVLYGGVVEEVFARWGLMNLAAFFALIFTNQYHNFTVWMSIFISGLVFAVGQIPAYLAAGCTANRNFIYSLIILSLYQSLLFGYLFWQYGLMATILCHMLFQIEWFLYEKIKIRKIGI